MCRWAFIKQLENAAEASRLLACPQGMGYKYGQGLGKDSTGIATPVEAFHKHDRLGLGAGVLLIQCVSWAMIAVQTEALSNVVCSGPQ